MIHPIRTWNRFFFGLTSARPLGALRIAFGLVALSNLAFCAVDMDHWFSDAGLLRGDESRLIAGPFVHSPLQYLQSPGAVRATFAFTALAAVGLTVGWRTKLMSILFYGGMLSIHARNTVSSSGADVLLMVMTFNLMISPCGAALSVDSYRERRRRGTDAEPVILLWPLRLMQFQIALVYTFAAILKCGGNLWLNGTAIHYVLHNSEVRRLDLTFLEQSPSYPILINLMTYSALVMEFSLAFFIWFRAMRPAVLYMGLALHLGILATINIPAFGELMWAGYLAFLTPPEFDAFARAIDVRRWFARRPGVAADPVGTVAIAAEVRHDPAMVPIAIAAGPGAIDPDFDFRFDDLDDLAVVPEPASSGAIRAEPDPPRLSTIRVDGASAVPPPHRPAATAPASDSNGRPQTSREFAESALEPWDSFQILM